MDDLLTAFVLSQIIEKNPLKGITTRKAEEAISVVERSKVKIAVIDREIQNWKEVAKKAGARGARVIFITDDHTKEDPSRRVFAKPIDYEKFEEAIASIQKL